LQRLYSTFARGWPGVGLLCLRLIAVIAAVHYAVIGFVSQPTFLTTVIEGLAGLLLCAGLWTPIAGAGLSIFAFWSAFSVPREPWGQILLAVVGAALAMLGLATLAAGIALLGPGAWSVDARLFGRKRFNISPKSGVTTPDYPVD